MNRFLINLALAAAVIIPMLTVYNKEYFLSLPVVSRLELAMYDWRMLRSVASKPNTVNEQIAIIDVDDASVERHGSWPWGKNQVASLITNLRDKHHAKMIVLTTPLRKTSNRQVENIFDELQDDFQHDRVIVSAIGRLKESYDYDSLLIRSLDGRQVILGYEFEDSSRSISNLPDPVVVFNTENGGIFARTEMRDLLTPTPEFSGYSANDREFLNLALGSGFIANTADEDGVIRRIQLLSNFAGEPYSGAVLEILKYYDNPFLISKLQGTPYSWFPLVTPAFNKIGVGDRIFPINRDGSLLLNFTSAGGANDKVFPYFSAGNLLSDGQSRISDLNDRVVFIGSSASEVNDIVRTPLNPRLPQVETMAIALSSILNNDLLVVPANAWLVEGITLAVLGFLLSFLLPMMSPVISLLFTVTVSGIVYYVNYEYFWQSDSIVYRIVPFFILLSLMFFWNILAGFLLEWNSKRHVQGVLGQYLPPSLAKQLGEKKGFSMEGEIRNMSIMFSDVRGFTTISERFSARDLTKFMNQMLTVLSREIHENSGTIDKYIGDAVMAFWNAPLDDPNHATNSVRAAMGMQAAMAKLSKELIKKGLPELKMGVGINSGEACVGNMGSSIRLAYTVMGDTVNLASRLEGITKQYGISMIVGEQTYSLSKDQIIYRPVDAVRVKGKSQAVTIYEPLCEVKYVNPEISEIQTLSLRVWQAYTERRFSEMYDMLVEGCNRFPEDGLFKLYLERATKLLEAPPGDDWEPVTNFETK